MMLMPSSGSENVLTSTSPTTLCTVTPSIQALSQKDTTWTKLFVGGLPYHTTDKTLRDHFEMFGEIEEAVVITDRSTGKSRGYGFVIMASKESAERACKEPNPIIDGRKANVNLAILGAKPRGNLTAASIPMTALRPGFPTLLPSQFGQAVPSAAAAAGSPYLQQLYAAAATPYMHPNILGLTSMGSGNPLLDFYGQYAAAAAAAGFPAVTQAMIAAPSAAAMSQATIDSTAMQGPYFGYTYAPSYAQQLAAAGLPYAVTAAPTAGSAAAAAGAGQPPAGQPDSRLQ